MRHCPQCLQWYIDAAAECPDCDITTVAGPPPGDRDYKRDKKLVCIYHPVDEIQADLIVSMLAQEGIKSVAMASREHAGQAPGIMAQPLALKLWGGIHVLEHQAVKAANLTKEYLSATPSFPDAEGLFAECGDDQEEP